MLATTLATMALAATEPPKTHHHHYRTHYATATCYNLRGTTASGYPTGPGVAAHNFLPKGTRFRLLGKQSGPGGRRRFVVRDTGPALRDGHFDLWHGGNCSRFGVRTIKYKMGWGRP